jgi:superfamily II DNA or RNA helicase
MELRDYQLKAVEQVKEKLIQGKKRICLCLPTGAGKTVIFSSIANQSINKGKKVLIAVHRKELKKQAESKTSADVYMVETLNNLIKSDAIDINNYDLLIIDEVHIGNFRKVIEKYNGYIIGCTATPISSKKDFPLKQLLEDIVNPVSIPELIESNRLSKPRTFARVPNNMNLLKKVGSDYSEKSQNLVFNSLVVYTGLVEDYLKNCNNKKTIVFCCSISHSINVYNAFIDSNVNAFLVHSKLKENERDDIIKEFSESTNGVMVNCGILTTGYDEPTIEVVMINRATASVPLWLQMVGRGSRITETKKEFFIYDYGENYKRLGMWEDYRDWFNIFFDDKKSKKGIAPTKDCPKCGYINFARAVECENCNYVFQSTKKEVEKTELQEILVNNAIGKKLYTLTLNEIFALAEKKKWKLMYVERLIYHIFGKAQLNDFFDKSNRKPYYRELRFNKYSNEVPPFNYIIK